MSHIPFSARERKGLIALAAMMLLVIATVMIEKGIYARSGTGEATPYIHTVIMHTPEAARERIVPRDSIVLERKSHPAKRDKELHRGGDTKSSKEPSQGPSKQQAPSPQGPDLSRRI